MPLPRPKGELGKVPPGLLYGGAAVAGVVLFLWWRNRQASSGAASTTNTAGAGLAAVGLPSVTDVVTSSGTRIAGTPAPATPPTGSGTGGKKGGGGTGPPPPRQHGGGGGAIFTGPGNARSRNLRRAGIPLSGPALNQPAQPSAGTGTVLATLPPRAVFPGSPGAQLVWPFPGGPQPSEFRRIDQGFDLQFPGTKPTPVLAIAPGIAGVAHDPSGFGVSYPTETFTHPIGGNTGAYYGHVQPVLVPGTRVKAGQIIGETFGPTSGGDAAGTPNWLEVGFLRNGQYPVFGQGSAMRQALLGARAAVQRATGQPALKAPAPPKAPAVPLPGAPRTLPLLPPVRRAPHPAARTRARAPRRPPRFSRGGLVIPFAPAAGYYPAPRRAPAPRRTSRWTRGRGGQRAI